MKMIAPIKLTKGLRKLPYNISKDVIIEKFIKVEKLQFFSLSELKISKDSIKFKPTGSILNRFLYDFSVQEYIRSNYKIEILGDDNSPGLIQKKLEILDFIFKVVLGIGFPIYKIATDDPKNIFSGGFFSGNKTVISRRNYNKLAKERLDQIKKIFEIIDSSSKNADFMTQLNLLKSWIDLAMSQTGHLGIAALHYVAILENILLKDGKEGGLRFKFSMRLAKLLNKNLDYVKELRSLYDKRSRLIHGGRDTFTMDEVTLLEDVACKVILAYLANMKAFEAEYLDRQLLN